MAWADRTSDEQQSVIDRLNESAQPLRDAIARETQDRDSPGAPPEMIEACNAAIATYEKSLAPIEDAIAVLNALA